MRAVVVLVLPELPDDIDEATFLELMDAARRTFAPPPEGSTLHVAIKDVADAVIRDVGAEVNR